MKADRQQAKRGQQLVEGQAILTVFDNPMVHLQNQRDDGECLTALSVA